MGPTGLTPTMLTDDEIEEIRGAYREQAKMLADGGVDLFVFETFRLLSEIRLALEAAREVAPNVPIVAQMAFDSDRKTGDGATPERVLLLLKDWGADVVGANCMEGPHVLLDVVEAMVGRGVPVIAQPNAGYPRKVDERLIYMATPEYFGVYARRFLKAGARIVGGCCGTGPEHVRSMVAAAKMMGGGHSTRPSNRLSVLQRTDDVGLEPTPVAERTRLSEKLMRVWNERVNAPDDKKVPLDRDSFVVSVEVNPPSGLDPAKSIRAAKMLRAAGVDVVNIADGPRASVRMSNWAFAALIQRELDTEVILHLCGRDRNLLGLQADVLAFNAIGLHNLVVITGDPPKVGDYPNATAVFDLDSIGILRMIENFNHGVDPAGKDVGDTTNFFCACGAEPAAADYDRELRRLEEKKKSGATFVMTQPVYDYKVLERFLDDIEHLEMPVLVGLLPLASHRNAEFLHNEVPGMAVPEDIRERMKKAGSGPQARAEGVAIAQETLLRVKDRVVGAYIMPPFGRYVAALEILECLPGYEVPDSAVRKPAT
jgi:homocysteine S-methyltransferase